MENIADEKISGLVKTRGIKQKHKYSLLSRFRSHRATVINVLAPARQSTHLELSILKCHTSSGIFQTSEFILSFMARSDTMYTINATITPTECRILQQSEKAPAWTIYGTVSSVKFKQDLSNHCVKESRTQRASN